jgi:hypothetical protein
MRRPALALALVALVAASAGAGEIGHYAGGVLNIRDLAVPDPGLYVALYNYGYLTNQLNDRHADAIDDVTIVGPLGRRTTLHLDVDVDIYVASPIVMWISPWTVLGAKYGGFIAPTFANSSVGAALDTATGRGINVDTNQFDVGDMYVQPVWLGWTLPHFDFSLGLGFTAPTGRYDVEEATVPGIGTIKAEDPTNIGYGFWSQQEQVAAYWYPWENRATAVGLGFTHEFHFEKEDFDITPGQDVTLNWGVSQYLPLASDNTLLLEVGPAGYDTWQITDDTGDDVTSTAHDQVHAAGAQMGVTYVPWSLVANFHWFWEYAAKDRFEGKAVGLSVGKKF